MEHGIVNGGEYNGITTLALAFGILTHRGYRMSAINPSAKLKRYVLELPLGLGLRMHQHKRKSRIERSKIEPTVSAPK